MFIDDRKVYVYQLLSYILTCKKNAIIELCQVRHVVHKHELTMTRTLSKTSGLFEFIDFGLSGMLAVIYMNILTAVTYFSFRVIYQTFECIVSFARQYICHVSASSRTNLPLGFTIR